MHILGLNVRNVTLGERSAPGMYAEEGSFIVGIYDGSKFTGILKPKDIKLSSNNKTVNNVRDLQEAVIAPNWSDFLMIVVFRSGSLSTIKVKK